MTAKEFVMAHYPLAMSESHKDNRGKKYWLIRDGRAYMYMASGDTESKSWVAAKKMIKERVKQTA